MALCTINELTKKLQDETLSMSEREKAFLGLSSAGAFRCLAAFILFLAQNANILTQFTTFLNGLKALISAQISLIQLQIAQLDVLNQVSNAFLQPFRALLSSTGGQLGLYNFAAFAACLPAQKLKAEAKKISDGLANKIKDRVPTPPGSTGIIKNFKNSLAWVKRKESEILRRSLFITKILQAEVEKLRGTEKFFDAIINSINDCLT